MPLAAAVIVMAAAVVIVMGYEPAYNKGIYQERCKHRGAYP